MPRSKLAQIAAEKNLSARLYIVSRILVTLQNEFEHPRLNELVDVGKKQLYRSMDDIEFAFGIHKTVLPCRPRLEVVK